MKIAVEGCCHGELDKIYATLEHMEKANNTKVDLLLICGDFQAVRNRGDLDSMAVPSKFQKLNTFYKYYSGEKVAPVLTIFIGGNHEASNYMQELTYGGWVAENIYYMGYANVVQVGDLRIGGLSGIYKQRDYFKGHHEYPPYNGDTKRSVYHIRNIEVFRLKQLTRPLDIFMSHDWPSDIARYGNMEELFRRKPFLKEEVLDGSLGSPPAAKLLHKLQPSYWFSAHLHVKYTAHVEHPGGNATKFLALDKCLPRRQFLQVLDFPDKGDGPVKLSWDPEWLCLLQKTNDLMHLGKTTQYMPEGTSFEVSDDEIAGVVELFEDLTVPRNFETTAPTLAQQEGKKAAIPVVIVNPQTSLLCSVLDLKDPNAVHLGVRSNRAMLYSLRPERLQSPEGSGGSDDDDDDDDDDVATDVSSSFNTSTINSSLDTLYSPTSPYNPRQLHDLSATASPPPVPQVEDDDEEFQAILAAQRRNSQQITSPVQGKTDQKKDSSSEGDQKISLPSSPKTEDTDDELASTIAAQRQKASVSSENAQKLEADVNACAEKSSSDIESTSQDSQDDLDRPGYLGDSSQASTTDCVEVSASSDSPTQGGGQQGVQAAKHPSSSSLGAVHASVKKLKRRNVSMYSSSGTEEEPC